jgi:hypothetical protein
MKANVSEISSYKHVTEVELYQTFLTAGLDMLM